LIDNPAAAPPLVAALDAPLDAPLDAALVAAALDAALVAAALDAAADVAGELLLVFDLDEHAVSVMAATATTARAPRIVARCT
jgi:hypothetical protein